MSAQLANQTRVSEYSHVASLPPITADITHYMLPSNCYLIHCVLCLLAHSLYNTLPLLLPRVHCTNSDMIDDDESSRCDVPCVSRSTDWSLGQSPDGHQTHDDGGESDSDQLLTSTLTNAGVKCMVRARGVTTCCATQGTLANERHLGVTNQRPGKVLTANIALCQVSPNSDHWLIKTPAFYWSHTTKQTDLLIRSFKITYRDIPRTLE